MTNPVKVRHISEHLNQANQNNFIQNNNHQGNDN
jgi:hypothetical protein